PVALYRERSKVDGGPCRVHGGRVADSRHDGLRGQFLEEGVFACRRDRAALMVSAALQGHSPGSGAHDRQWTAEMLLGELGVGYLSWIEWNNLDIAGVIFAILVVGVVGVILDAGFNKLA